MAHIVRAWKRRAPDDRSPIDVAAGEAQRWKLDPPRNRKTRYVVVTGDIAERLTAAIKGRTAGEYVFLRRAQPWRYEGFQVDRRTPAVKAAGIEKRLTPTCPGTPASSGRSPRA